MLLLGAGTVGLLLGLLPLVLGIAEEQVPLVWSLLLLVPAGWTWLGLQRRTEAEEQPWLRAPVLIGLWIVFGWGLPGLLACVDRDLLRAMVQMVGVDVGCSTQAMTLVIGGVGTLWLGYLLGLRVAPVGSAGRQATRRPLLGRVALLYGITVVLRLWESQAGEGALPSAVRQWAEYLAQTRYLCLALTVMAVASRRWRPGFLLVIWICELYFAFTGAFMKPLLWITLVTVAAASLAGWSLKRALRSPAISLALVLLLGLGIALVPISLQLRQSWTSGDGSGISPFAAAAAAGTAAQETWGQGADVGWTMFLDKMLGRQGQVPHTFGIVMRDTPAVIDYQGAPRLLAVPLFLIPRLLWPDKPVLDIGRWFSRTYLGFPQDTITSSAISIFFEPYLYAGCAGTLGALAVMGFILGVLYRATMLRGLQQRNLFLVALYLALLPWITDVEWDYTSYFCGVVQLLVVMPFLGCWVTTRRPARSVAEAA